MRTLEIFNCRHDFLLTSGLILSQHVSISYHIFIRAFANSIRRASPHTKLTIIFRPIFNGYPGWRKVDAVSVVN
jgi:hypothetical protein